MTDPYRPVLRTQAQLERAWHHLVRPLGFHRRSLWLLLIGPDDRPTPVMTEITDLPHAPDEETTEGMAQLLAHFVSDDADHGRWAFLLSRPGRHPVDEADRIWAAALYDVCRGHGIAHDVVHLASDTDIVPVPLDEVTDYLRAS
jgi:hypothetical protein